MIEITSEVTRAQWDAAMGIATEHVYEDDPSSPSNRENSEKELSDSEVAISIEDGYVTGLVAYRVEGDTATVDALATAAEARKRGFGRMLLEHVEDEAAYRGAREIELESMDNKDTISFYRRMGYSEITRLSFRKQLC
jgi:ribosomal protein S18 acetylase RimI-like enzyme